MGKKATNNKKKPDELMAFAFRDVPVSVISEFKKLHAQLMLDRGEKISMPEALALVIQMAKEQQPGITLSDDQMIIDKINYDQLTNDNIELQNKNENLTEQLKELQDKGSASVTELEGKLQEALDNNRIIAEQLIELSKNTPQLQEGEFICKISKEAYEIVSKLKPFLEQNNIIVVPEGEGFTETLANYCIVKMLRFNYSHLLKQ